MTDETNVPDLPQGGVPDAAPAELPEPKGLDSYLSGAIEEHMPDDTPQAPRERDPATGRFVPKNTEGTTETPPAEVHASTETPPADPSETPPEDNADQTPATAVEIPRNLTAEQKAAFTALPPEAQRMVADLERDRTADFTRRSQEMSDYRKVADPYVRAVQPFQGYLSQVAQLYGPQTHPAELVQQLLQAEYVLRTGSPDQKAAALRDIAADYGISLPQAGEAAPGQTPQAQPDPVISQLHQRVQGLSQQFQSLVEAATAQENAAAEAAINSFRDAKADDGSPKYPFFDVVMQSMGNLMGQRPELSMEQAYAIAAKPIEDRTNAMLKTKAEQSQAQQRQRVEKAQRAQSPKSSGSVPGGHTPGTKSLDAILNESIGKHYTQ